MHTSGNGRFRELEEEYTEIFISISFGLRKTNLAIIIFNAGIPPRGLYVGRAVVAVMPFAFGE